VSTFHRHTRIGLVVAPLVAWAAGALAYNANVALPSCPFKAITGFDCPGCGATRAGASLIQGDVLAALDHHALLIVLPAAFALFWAIKSLVPAVQPACARLAQRPALSALVVIGVFWAARLLPFAPFDVLAAGTVG
jgi:hypothetical protein